MAKHWEHHPIEVEGCFGCKALGLQMDAGAAKSSGIPTAKEHDKELGAYYDATRQDIKAAVEISNDAGKAFDGVNLTFN
jgi:hypothetical protein